MGRPMDTLVVMLPEETRRRLEALAARTGRTLGQCLEDAVFEFVENWEAHLADVGRLEEGEERPFLRAVNS